MTKLTAPPRYVLTILAIFEGKSEARYKKCFESKIRLGRVTIPVSITPDQVRDDAKGRASSSLSENALMSVWRTFYGGRGGIDQSASALPVKRRLGLKPCGVQKRSPIFALRARTFLSNPAGSSTPPICHYYSAYRPKVSSVMTKSFGLISPIALGSGCLFPSGPDLST